MVFKDRTAELLDILGEIKMKQGYVHHERQIISRKEQASQFYARAKRVTDHLSETSDLLNKLTKRIKQKSVFDDNAAEIQNMSSLVKDKISILHNELEELQHLRDASAGWTRETQSDKHTKAVVSELRTQLMDTTKNFKDVLTTRNENVHQTMSRRQQLSRDAPQLETQLLTTDDYDGYAQEVVMQEAHDHSYYSARVSAVNQVESTIAELGQMFQEFARIVAEQEDTIIRIDDDTASALDNITNAETQLRQYYRRLSTNRSLILKIFGVIIFFVLFFGLFVLK